MPHPELAKDIEMGLPIALAQEITDSDKGAPLSWIANWLYLILAICGFVAIAFLWPYLENKIEANVLAEGQKMGALAIAYNFGVSLVAIGFVWLFVVALAISALILWLPTKPKATLYIWTRSEIIGPWPKLYRLHHVINKAATFQTGSAFIDAICRKMISLLLKLTIPGFTIAMMLVFFEMRSYSMITPTAAQESPFFSTKMKTKLWKEATQIELGCNFIEARNGRYSKSAKQNKIIYSIEWQDGTSLSLRTENQINGKNWLDNFEIIDSAVRSGDATFKRWKWRERDPMHPNCIRHFKAQLGPEDQNRFDRLLRVGELD